MLGNKLVKLRKENKLSQDSLADKLGITRQTISNWELNITKPDIVQIKNISEIFNISIDELLDNNTKDIIEKKINDLFNSTNYVYKLNVILKTLNDEIKTTVIGRTQKYLITIDNKKIDISSILDIKEDN